MKKEAAHKERLEKMQVQMIKSVGIQRQENIDRKIQDRQADLA